MKTILAALVLCTAGVALAGPPPPPPPPPVKADAAPAKTDMKAGGDMKAPEAGMDPMAMWKPHKADAKKDEKGLEAAMKMMGESMMKGDMETVAGTIDFPVMMVTDTSAGNGMAAMMTKEQWMGAMKGMDKMKDMKMTEKHKIDWLTDSLAVVHGDHTATMGGKKMEWTASSLWMMKDGKWMNKMMAEGGWGDGMGAKGASAPMPATDSKAAMK
jgi:hypothetical protein